MSLAEYYKKRDFNSTNEPKGEKGGKKSNRFVVQFHQARAKHYDFRLEHDGVLVSWAIPKGLSYNPNDKRLAVKVEDHPIDYINFEGIIPKGNYGAGTVEIFDKGNYMTMNGFSKGLKEGHIKVVLNGEKLKGGWSLVQFNDNNWMAIKLQDAYASDKVIKTTKKLPFKDCDIELAMLSDRLPASKDWIFEIKYDGYRIISYVEENEVRLLTRNKNDYTKRLNNIVSSIKGIDAGSFVLDGEVVAFDEQGKSDFGLLQNRLKTGKGDIYYVVFDLLALDGEDLRSLPLIERKNKLERLLFDCKNNIMYSSHVENGEACFKFAKDHELEGIVAKRKYSKYIGRRTEDWLKVKCYLRQEFVIGGYTTSSKNEMLSALLLGYYQEGKLVYVGKVGTGFSNKTRQELSALFQKIKAKKSPFSEKIREQETHFLSPKLVAEIQFVEFTKDGALRQPSFVGLRTDKAPKDVILEGSSHEN